MAEDRRRAGRRIHGQHLPIGRRRQAGEQAGVGGLHLVFGRVGDDQADRLAGVQVLAGGVDANQVRAFFAHREGAFIVAGRGLRQRHRVGHAAGGDQPPRRPATGFGSRRPRPPRPR